MMTFSQILFCTDFSEGAANAFRYAVKAAMQNNAVLHILHVMPEAGAQFWKGYVVEDGQDLSAKNNDALQSRIKQEYASLLPESVEWHAHLAIGAAASKITEFVREYDISLVVTGRPRPRFLRSLLFGSVAAKVARTVECPILIVPCPGVGSRSNGQA